ILAQLFFVLGNGVRIVRTDPHFAQQEFAGDIARSLLKKWHNVRPCRQRIFDRHYQGAGFKHLLLGLDPRVIEMKRLLDDGMRIEPVAGSCFASTSRSYFASVPPPTGFWKLVANQFGALWEDARLLLQGLDRSSGPSDRWA